MIKQITFLYTVAFLLFTFSAFSQTGYEIKVNIDGFENDSLLLGYQYADKQYIKDTVVRVGDTFTFSGDEPLDCGIYLVIMPPENRYFQIVVDDKDQKFMLTTNVTNPVDDAKFKGSEENETFYKYLNFIGKQSTKAQELNKQMKANKELNKDVSSDQVKLDAIDDEVNKFQLDLIGKHAGSMAARIVKASRDVDVPDFGTTDEARRKRFYYLRDHWFDNTDLSDPCMIRTTLLHNKVMTYLEKLTVQHPDSISQSIDFIIEKAKGNDQTKRNWLSTLLNKYANSKVIGMDAVYVHIVMNYYAKGEASWVEPEKLLEIVDNATKTEPLLIGKISPEILMPTLDVEGTLIAMEKEEDEQKKFVLGEKVSLHKLDSPYKVLFIWAPDCGHCKKSMPKMIDFYNNYKDKGVELFAICHQNYKSTPACAEFIKERPEMLQWINVTDPYFRSRYQSLYNVKSTPQIYILDDKNEILFKRLGADQLPGVMDDIFKREKK